jgi:hypothetical protein
VICAISGVHKSQGLGGRLYTINLEHVLMSSTFKAVTNTNNAVAIIIKVGTPISYFLRALV